MLNVVDLYALKGPYLENKIFYSILYFTEITCRRGRRPVRRFSVYVSNILWPVVTTRGSASAQYFHARHSMFTLRQHISI